MQTEIHLQQLKQIQQGCQKIVIHLKWGTQQLAGTQGCYLDPIVFIIKQFTSSYGVENLIVSIVYDVMCCDGWEMVPSSRENTTFHTNTIIIIQQIIPRRQVTATHHKHTVNIQKIYKITIIIVEIQTCDILWGFNATSLP